MPKDGLSLAPIPETASWSPLSICDFKSQLFFFRSLVSRNIDKNVFIFLKTVFDDFHQIRFINHFRTKFGGAFFDQFFIFYPIDLLQKCGFYPKQRAVATCLIPRSKGLMTKSRGRYRSLFRTYVRSLMFFEWIHRKTEADLLPFLAAWRLGGKFSL